MIVSTGMASLGEIENLVKTIKDAGCVDFILLKCTSSYPASPENSNLNTIPFLYFKGYKGWRSIDNGKYKSDSSRIWFGSKIL